MTDQGTTCFAAMHRCGAQLQVNGMPICVRIATVGGLTSHVDLVHGYDLSAEPIPDSAFVTCTCGEVAPDRTAREAREHFDRASRRWDTENPPA